MIKTTTNKEVTIIATCDLGIGSCTITSNKLLRVFIKKGEKVTLNNVKAGKAFLEKLDCGPYLNLFIFDDFSDVSPGVRKWAANPKGNKHTLADAIVISSFAQKIVADFYLKFNKPVKPTRVFRDEQKAKDWLFSLNLV